jgi:hypothetical protein
MASTKIACLLGPGLEDSEFRISGRTLTRATLSWPR